jgi:hypothetical protein
MLEILREILAADFFCYAVAGTLALFAGMVMSSVTSSFGLAAFYTPGIAFGGLSGIYAIREAGMRLSGDAYTDVVLSAAAGTLAGLAIMLVLTRLIHALTLIRKPVTRPAPNPYRT